MIQVQPTNSDGNEQVRALIAEQIRERHCEAVLRAVRGHRGQLELVAIEDQRLWKFRVNDFIRLFPHE